MAIDEAYDGWVDVPPSRCRELAAIAARAAIEALREPDNDMVGAGAFHCIQGAGGVSPADKAQATAVFRAMIDAALSPSLTEDHP